MKGIILAGGKGTRLYPITKAISKQLLPVFDKPMIYYPINTLVKINIKDILIITTPEDQIYFKNLLINNKDFNCNFEFEIQKKPKGIAEAFIIGEKFIKNDDVCLILGDNLFFNSSNILNNDMTKSSRIFVKREDDPNKYGVLEEKNAKPIKIHEKPIKYISNHVVVGLYMFSNNVLKFVKKLTPSKRGELEITDLNNIYIKNNDCEIIYLEEESTWFDCGNFESLYMATKFVKENHKF